MKRFHWIALALVAVAGTAWGCASQNHAADTESQTATQVAEAALTPEQAVQTTDAGTSVTLYVTSDGFVPAKVHVPAGRPVTLHVTRKTERTCATELVMKAMNIRRALPLNEAVDITFTPNEAGDLRYACPMDMVAGTITVD